MKCLKSCQKDTEAQGRKGGSLHVFLVLSIPSLCVLIVNFKEEYLYFLNPYCNDFLQAKISVFILFFILWAAKWIKMNYFGC
jgi:hypothetical protein